MRIVEPGPVTDRILLLGREESSVYLVRDGNEAALVGGGMAAIIPDVLAQLAEYQVDEHTIRRIIILHTHFDHLGIVPYFKKRWPWARITASVRGKAQLARPEVIETIFNLSQAMLTWKGMEDRLEEFCLSPTPIQVDETLSDGDELSVGGLTLKILEVPGHSSCSIAVYIPEEKALFASDAGGIPYGDQVFPAANSNFDLYQESLEKMAALDVEIHLAEHNGGYKGQDGRDFMKKSIETARQARAMIEDIYARTGDEAQATAELVKVLSGQPGDNFLSDDIMNMVIGQMVRFIAKRTAQNN